MLSILLTTLILKLTTKLGRGGTPLLRLYNKAVHMTGAFFAAVEGHLICRYCWPACYPLVFWVQKHTGIDLTGFRY